MSRNEPQVGDLELRNVSRHFGATRAADDVSLQVEAGKTLALLGPSGCGKSTLLRVIAGLEPPTSGSIFFGGAPITHKPPQRRRFGMVFQDYALFPHLDVAQNIAYGLVEQGLARQARASRVRELLELVGLPGYETRRLHELSGGEQQRVALARALAPKPALLLLDEPLSSLDQTLRESLKSELKTLLNALDISAIYVTHDQSEAFYLADRIALMKEGNIVQVAAAQSLYGAPATRWAARFLGHRNLYSSGALGQWLGHREASAPYTLVRSDLVRLGAGQQRAVVTALSQTGGLLELLLTLTPQNLPFVWQGTAREVPTTVQVGDEVKLEALAGAHVALMV